MRIMLLIILNAVLSSKLNAEKVSSGRLAEITEHPHAVHIFIKCKLDGTCHTCGGSLLTENRVLTAASCFQECYGGVSAILGAGSADSMRTDLRKMTKYTKHPKFTFDLYAFSAYDAAIVSVSSDFELNDVTKKVLIALSPPDHGAAMLTGWRSGAGRTDGVVANQLVELHQNVVLPEMCEKNRIAFPKASMCALNREASDAPDLGDGGSALMRRGHTQVGIMSYKEHDTEVSVYVNVHEIHVWIMLVVKSGICPNDKLDLTEFDLRNF